MTYKVSHMVHSKHSNQPTATRSIAVDVGNADYGEPHVTVSASKHGFNATIFFATAQQLQDYVNECRAALDEWITEDMENNNDE